MIKMTNFKLKMKKYIYILNLEYDVSLCFKIKSNSLEYNMR